MLIRSAEKFIGIEQYWTNVFNSNFPSILILTDLDEFIGDLCPSFLTKKSWLIFKFMLENEYDNDSIAVKKYFKYRNNDRFCSLVEFLKRSYPQSYIRILFDEYKKGGFENENLYNSR